MKITASKEEQDLINRVLASARHRVNSELRRLVEIQRSDKALTTIESAWAKLDKDGDLELSQETAEAFRAQLRGLPYHLVSGLMEQLKPKA
jgi:hypothetical protein